MIVIYRVTQLLGSEIFAGQMLIFWVLYVRLKRVKWNWFQVALVDKLIFFLKTKAKAKTFGFKAKAKTYFVVKANDILQGLQDWYTDLLKATPVQIGCLKVVLATYNPWDPASIFRL